MVTKHDGRRSGWIGVDLDGTVAEYDRFRDAEHIGPPIPKMADRVRRWLADGVDVRIVTARVAPQPHFTGMIEVHRATIAIMAWCKRHFGEELPVQHWKDYGMFQLWDDRAVQVIPNTGMAVEDGIAHLEQEVATLRDQNDRLRAEVARLTERLDNPEEGA